MLTTHDILTLEPGSLIVRGAGRNTELVCLSEVHEVREVELPRRDKGKKFRLVRWNRPGSQTSTVTGILQEGMEEYTLLDAPYRGHDLVEEICGG